MPHRIDRHMTRPDADGGDIHTAAVFLLSFLLMGIVSAIVLTGQGFGMPDLSQNRLIANFVVGSRAPSKAPEASNETQAPMVVVSAEEEVQKPEPAGEEPARKTTIRVANTGGTGVYIRRTPDMVDRLVAWPDNTIMEIVGEDRVVGTIRWRQVKDPAGNTGWIPAEYLSD